MGSNAVRSPEPKASAAPQVLADNYPTLAHNRSYGIFLNLRRPKPVRPEAG